MGLCYREAVSRFLASLLLVLFSFPLISPAFADFDSNIPACCRRAGKHACELAGHRHSGSGPQFASPYCPQFPGRAIPASARLTGRALMARAYFALRASRPAHHEQTHALYWLSYSRTGQKRGPPVSLS